MRNIHEFLDLIESVTLDLEGHASTLEGTIPGMDLILSHFESFKERYHGNKVMGAMLNAGWRKMNKYYKLTDESPAYIAAIVLNPNLKWQYIRHNWEADWIPAAEAIMEDFWGKQYKPQGETPAIEVQRLAPASGNAVPRKRALAEFMRGHQAVRAIEDEYSHYIQQDTTFDEPALTWWLLPAQQNKYPNLSKMAIDVLTIPAMSAEPERVFSRAKLTLTDQRNRLGVELLGAFECLKSWYKLGNFDSDNALQQATCSEEAPAEDFGARLEAETA